MRRHSNTILISLIAICASLVGCVNLKPKPDAYSLYLLGNQAEVSTIDDSGESGRSLYVAPPNLPPYLASKQLVYTQANGVAGHLRHARWAEPLAEGIARTVAENINAHADAIAAYYPWPKPRTAEVLKINFYQIEAESGGRFITYVEWRLVDLEANVERSGRFQLDDIRWSPERPDSYVAAYNQMLRALVHEILQGGGPGT